MAHEVEVQWMGKMQFNALVGGHTIIMDGPEKVGGEDNGPIPKPLVLAALAGCTGMDIVAILKKTAKAPDDFDMKITGEISQKPPIEYTAIHIIYSFRGNEENLEAALKAVIDSQERYCGVSSMLKKALPVTWEIHYNDRQLFNNKPQTSEGVSIANCDDNHLKA